MTLVGDHHPQDPSAGHDDGGSADGPDPLAPTPPERRSRRPWMVGGALVGLAVVAILAFGVFGVQALFVDDEVEEAAFEFDSGAVTPGGASTPAEDPAPSTTAEGATAPPAGAEPGSVDGAAPAPPPATTAPQPSVELVATGGFSPGDHPGSGTANIFTDGNQSVVRFEDDFATDNGPDLFAVVYVGEQRIELGRLKGNQGSQNYELPPDLDPSTIDAVSVWCKRFDSTFTTATVA